MGLGFTLDNVITISLKRNHHKLLITSPHPLKKTRNHMWESCSLSSQHLLLCGGKKHGPLNKREKFFKSPKPSYRYRRFWRFPRKGNDNPVSSPSGEEWNADQRFSRRGSLCLRQKSNNSGAGCSNKVRRKQSKWPREVIYCHFSFSQNTFISFYQFSVLEDRPLGWYRQSWSVEVVKKSGTRGCFRLQ